MATICLTYEAFGETVHSVPIVKVQDDGKGYELFHVSVETGAESAIMKIKLDGPPTIQITSNINGATTGLAAPDGVVEVEGYTKN